MQSSNQIITTNKPTSSFLQAGCPSCRPTNSVKALKVKISHSMDLLTPSSPGGLSTLSLINNSSVTLWEGCHASHQPSDASTPTKLHSAIINDLIWISNPYIRIKQQKENKTRQTLMHVHTLVMPARKRKTHRKHMGLKSAPK